jgi:hypothetical protein
MTNANAHGETAAKDFALKSLQMAAERTDLALIRTGFTTATFGAGMTHLIGRGIWPDRMVDILTIIFVIAGALGVQAPVDDRILRFTGSAGSNHYHDPGPLGLKRNDETVEDTHYSRY